MAEDPICDMELKTVGLEAISRTNVPSHIMLKSSASAVNSPISSILDEGKSCEVPQHAVTIQYRLYKRRFSGLLGLFILGLAAGMPWSWFGPISNNVAADFDITLDQVNWLGNIISCLYLVVSLLLPTFCSRYGIRRCSEIGAAALLISAWVRYAGTASHLSSGSSYAFLLLGQTFTAIAQPIFQIVGPKYSEKWFDLDGRTTATMILSVATPIGGAVGQLISPLVGTSRQSILILAIITTAVTPALFLISSEPPSPPTYAGSKKSRSLPSLVQAILGRDCPKDAFMSKRERLDFVILILLFGVLVAATDAITLLSAQYMQPYGYSDDVSGLMGATLLLSGITAAAIAAPLLDRVATKSLGMVVKILVPIVVTTWFSMIWAVRPHNTAALFVIMAIIGIASVTMLPIALELGCELTRNADASTAILWFSGNLFGVIFILGEGALRAGPDAHPPYHMHNALIMQGCILLIIGFSAFFLQGKQGRRELDEQKINEQKTTGMLEDTIP
ncbi:MFS general substrate transporter [Hygrophoropsis aurantiaca]|uniref:MFS general substrate transporter n=1 Tax=Hygrophoropsis aurantiaca TaxID=72124 RepID=A0ACB8AL29_9AGAM|nr:MFS general substrate transporter [Hygrophoropsis aurantiaca]